MKSVVLFFACALSAATASAAAPVPFVGDCNSDHEALRGTFTPPEASDLKLTPLKPGVLVIEYDGDKEVDCDFIGNYCANQVNLYAPQGCEGVELTKPITVTFQGKTYRSKANLPYSADGVDHWSDPKALALDSDPVLVCPNGAASLKYLGWDGLRYPKYGNGPVIDNGRIKTGVMVDKSALISRADYEREGVKAFGELNWAGVGLSAADGSKINVTLGIDGRGDFILEDLRYHVKPGFLDSGDRTCSLPSR